LTNRAPRSQDEELAEAAVSDRPGPELVSSSLLESVDAPEPPASPALSGRVAASEAAGARELEAFEVESLDAALLEEPSSRELTAPELAGEGLDALEGVALSPVGEPAAPLSETEEVTSDQLLPDDDAAPAPAGSSPAAQYRASDAPRPWVDQVADPVTPYEQRVSETVKVAELPPAEQLRGRVLANRYLAEEVAEQTAASLSYRAYHLALDRAVTVRILPRGLACSDELCQEVRGEARVASSLSNPHIAAALDFGVTSDGWPFLVTETFQGRTLALLLAEEGKFVLRRVLHIGRQLASALAAAHQAGLVHGLLSPDNVMVVEPGTSAEVATVLAFGVHRARGATPAPPRSGVFGVPFYVSPEQAACRPLDVRSDIYSLGVILYELMTGAPPFTDGDFAAVLCQHLDDDPEAPSTRLPSPGALAKAMDAIVERCLRKDPEQRYQSAAELGDDLTRLEAAAARNKRRPMPEIQRPTTTIHSPPPRADSSHAAQGAKVIVHGDPDDAGFDPNAEGRGSSPGNTPAAPAARAPVTAAPRTVSKRPARISVDQATIKISAVDRELAMALHRRKNTPSQPLPSRGAFAAVFAGLALLAKWVVRLFGGGSREAAPSRDDSRGR
jgi:serine/threonine protein kinase